MHHWAGPFGSAASRRADPRRLTLGATQRTGRVRVCFDEVRVRFTRFETAVCLKAASCGLVPLVDQMSRKRKRSWTADALCRMDADCDPMSICEQGDRLSLGTNSEQRRAHAKTPHRSYRDFCCRRLSSRTVRTTIFIPTSRASRGNLLCRADWLCLRGIAGTECAILPRFKKSPPLPRRCSACEQTSSGERPTARRSLPHRNQSTNSVGQPAENQQDNQPEEKRRIRRLTWYHSCRGSYIRSSSLLTVRISLADALRGISSPNPTGSLRRIAGAECDILPFPDRSQLLSAWCWPLVLFCDMESTSHLFAIVTLTSANTALLSSSTLSSVSAQDISSNCSGSCRGRPNRGKWTRRSDVVEREHCLSRLPCGRPA